MTPPPTGDGTTASVEKPAKKGWFSSFTTAPKKTSAAAVPATASNEPTVEMGKEAEVSLGRDSATLLTTGKLAYQVFLAVRTTPR